MLRIVAFLILGLFPIMGMGAEVPVSGDKLDVEAIHAIYLDGDFEKCIQLIEDYLKSKKPMDRSDSIFAYKHLGTMYAANESTREKGKYYMLKLISMEPAIRLMDMYASDMIDAIFTKLKTEYEDNLKKKMGMTTPDSTKSANVSQVSSTKPGSKVPEKREPAPVQQKSNKWIWIGGGTAGAIIAGTTIFLLSSGGQEIKNQTIVVGN